MKLIMVSPYPIGPNFGGVEAVADALIPALSKREEVEELHVITFLHGSPKQSSRPLEKGLHYQIYSQDRFELFSTMIGDVRRLQSICNRIKPDIVHAQGLSKEGILVVQEAYPSVVTVHGLVHIERRLKNPTPTTIQRLRFYLADRQIDMVLKRANLIISTSTYDKNALAGKIYSPTVSIPNPVPIEFFNTFSIDDGESILFVGVVQPRKNLAGIVRAFSKIHQNFHQAQLRIVGPTPSIEYVTQIKQLAKALGVEKDITWLGHITQEQLIAEYAKCSLVIMFSNEETSPMAVAQATAMGKPVVAANVGGMSDMVMEGETGYLIPKGDDHALAARITSLLMDENLRKRMGKLAKEIAQERCHPDKVADRTILAYQTIKSRL